MEAKKNNEKEIWKSTRQFRRVHLQKGKMGITFTVDDGKVSAIQYVAY